MAATVDKKRDDDGLSGGEDDTNDGEHKDKDEDESIYVGDGEAG